MAGTRSLLAEPTPDRGDVSSRSRHGAAPGEARAGVLGQRPDLTGIRGSQTVLWAAGQAEEHERTHRPGRGDRTGQSSQSDDVAASPTRPALHLLDQAHGADRIECAQRHDARDPVGGDRCQAIGATLIAFVITVP